MGHPEDTAEFADEAGFADEAPDTDDDDDLSGLSAVDSHLDFAGAAPDDDEYEADFSGPEDSGL